MILTYDVDDEEEFTISVSGDLLTMVDQFGYEYLLDKQIVQSEEPKESEETEETDPENPLVEAVIGTWTEYETGCEETFTFNADGTGYYSYNFGEYESAYTYVFYNSEYIEMYFDDGSVVGFQVIMDESGEEMAVRNEYVWDLVYKRQ